MALQQIVTFLIVNFHFSNSQVWRSGAHQVAFVQEKLDADVEKARAAVSGLEAAAWKLEANFGGLEP